MSTFLFYMQMLTFNFQLISYTTGNFASLAGACDKIVLIMKIVPKVNQQGGDKIEGEVDGSIEFRNVEF